MFSVLQTVQKADGFYLGGAFRLDCPPVLSCYSHYISGCCMFLPFPSCVAFGFHLNSVLLTVCGICYILCGDRRDVLGRAGDKIIQILLPVRLLPLTLCSWVT